jgi:ATP-dependent Clp protease adaptor protein ClpS
MSLRELLVSRSTIVTDPSVTTEPQEETRTRLVPPYNVILLNDDYHSFEFVLDALRKALGYSVERCYQLTLQAHTSGRAVVWTGPLEVAELKANHIRGFKEVRAADGANLGSLVVEIEPAPG